MTDGIAGGNSSVIIASSDSTMFFQSLDPWSNRRLFFFQNYSGTDSHTSLSETGVA